MSNETNITEDIKDVFNALTSRQVSNFALFSCFVNGEPASAIVAITKDGTGFNVTPLFVSLTPSMVITDHEGVSPDLPSDASPYFGQKGAKQ